MRKQPTETPSGSTQIWSGQTCAVPAVDPACVIPDAGILDLGQTQIPSSAIQNKPHKPSSQGRTKGKDFPEQNAIRPNVTQRGVEVVKDALGCHPLHRQESLRGRREEINPQARL